MIKNHQYSVCYGITCHRCISPVVFDILYGKRHALRPRNWLRPVNMQVGHKAQRRDIIAHLQVTAWDFMSHLNREPFHKHQNSPSLLNSGLERKVNGGILSAQKLLFHPWQMLTLAVQLACNFWQVLGRPPQRAYRREQREFRPKDAKQILIFYCLFFAGLKHCSSERKMSPKIYS